MPSAPEKRASEDLLFRAFEARGFTPGAAPIRVKSRKNKKKLQKWHDARVVPPYGFLIKLCFFNLRARTLQ